MNPLDQSVLRSFQDLESRKPIEIYAIRGINNRRQGLFSTPGPENENGKWIKRSRSNQKWDHIGNEKKKWEYWNMIKKAFPCLHININSFPNWDASISNWLDIEDSFIFEILIIPTTHHAWYQCAYTLRLRLAGMRLSFLLLGKHLFSFIFVVLVISLAFLRAIPSKTILRNTLISNSSTNVYHCIFPI